MRWPFMSKKSPLLKTASIYWHLDKIIICPCARTRDGIRTALDIVAVSTPDDFKDIGQKTLEMLELCIDNIPDDYSRKSSSVDHAILREAKRKSWRAFQKEALLVSVTIEQMPVRVSISPWRRAGGGHFPVDGKNVFCDLDPKIIGETVMHVFKDAE
jgi:hypothetical protein